MKINKNSYIFSIVFTFVTTFVLVFPLTLANIGTKPIADDYWRVQRYVKTLLSLGIPADQKNPADAKKQYALLEKYTADSSGKLQKVSDEAIDKGEVTGYPINPLYYVTEVNGEKRFAGSFTGPGLWGNVSLALGVNKDVNAIEGLQVLYQVETPGLGGRISEKTFTDQFSGKNPSNSIIFNQGGAKADNGFDAIAGATITSTAVKDIVNKATPELKTLISKIGGM